MAGAVSAGAYTAGVLDYLIETLQLWYEHKAKGRNDVPDYDVEIDIIAGTSAGGMTATMLVLALLSNKLKPVTRESITQNTVKDNLLYDLWVNMLDDEEGSTFQKLLATSDLDENSSLESLLNSTVLEKIAARAFDQDFTYQLPAFVSKDIDLVMTVTNLDGLKFNLSFQGNNNAGGVQITTHDGFFRFRFPDAPTTRNEQNDQYYDIHLKGRQKRADIDILTKATLSTGAFPVGFKPVENQIAERYIKAYPKFIFDQATMTGEITPELPQQSKIINFTAIDGGAVNNEPYGLTKKLFDLKHQDKKLVEKGRYAVLMIDPFPVLNQKANIADDSGSGIMEVASRIITVLRNQVLFNQNALSSAINESDENHFLIAPVRKEKTVRQKVENPLATSALEGFAGFFHKSFREHDFILGRQNCQTALRYYFVVDINDVEQKLGPINEAAKQRFKIYKRNEERSIYFPIVPDMKVLCACENKYDSDRYGIEADLGYDKDGNVILPPYPKIDFATFKTAHQASLLKRLERILKKQNIRLFETKSVFTRTVERFVFKRLQKWGAKKIWGIVEHSLREHQLVAPSKKRKKSK